MMELPKYFYFRVKPNRHGTVIEIEDASAVDVVEVVRCKDCIHSPAAEDNCPLPVQYIVPEGYCHLGRGKDEQGEI